MKNKITFFSILVLTLSGAYAATPFFTITPISAGTQAAPQLLAPGQTIAATYQITNTSGATLSGIQLDARTLPSSGIVTQDTTSGTFADQCGATFTLANHQSCTLRLLVSGTVNQSTQTYGTPGICYGADNACSQATKANRLYVTATSAAPLLTINSISIGNMAGDTAASEFSTTINFTNGVNPLTNWQLGFYMPRSFAMLTSATQNINPRLNMQICNVNDPTNCANLVLQAATAISDVDQSVGNTTILAPQTTFSLVPNAQYVITLAYNNQWNVGNYSAYPQNFFMINAGLISNIPTTPSDYTLLNYDASKTTQTIAAHINTNWQNSNTVVTPLSVIPQPQNFAAGTGVYTLQNGLAIHNTLNSDNTVANFMAADLLSDVQISAPVDNQTAATGIIISKIADQELINNNPEGYQIVMTNGAINIYAINNTGVFYALQTLRQLWNQSTTLATGTITDYPQYKYRGVLLDTARHFFSVSQIETLIDLAATQKLNTLHMHFADDEAFRIGLNDYYTTIASSADTRGYGNNMMALMFIQANLDITTPKPTVHYAYVDTKYTGTYSESDLQDLISYANARSITIIPEIDLPGHARALIKAFPTELVDPNDQSKFISVQGYNDDVLPVCTYNTNISVGAKFTALINDIIAKSAALFKDQTTLYAANEISIGGDEVSSGAWTNDTSCIGTWSALSALQKSHKFFGMLAAANPVLKISGWQQYIQNDDVTLGIDIVPATQSGHVWVWNTAAPGILQAISLAQNNYPVVLAFADENYFDVAYTPAITEPGFTWSAPFLDTQAALSSAVSAQTVINGLVADDQKNILGLEGTLWSENLPSYEHMIYMALPKMAGLAEASWSNSGVTAYNNQPDWKDLVGRLGCGQTGHLAYLNKLYGVKYRGYPNGIALEVPAAVCPIN
jgi:hexosaminidase